MPIKANILGSGISAQAATSLIGEVANTLTALGTTQLNALLLSKTTNNVVTVGGSGTGVILPPGTGLGDQLQAGDWVRMVNYVSGNAILVYPPFGGKIQNGTLNASFSVAALKTATFTCIDGLNFFVTLSA